MLEELKVRNDERKIIILICLIGSLLIYGINAILDYLIIKDVMDYTLIKNSVFLHIKNVIVPIAILLGEYIFLVIKNKMVANKNAYLFLIPIGLILIGTSILIIPYNSQFLNIFILPLLSSMFLFSLTNKDYNISKWPLTMAFKLFPKNLFKNFRYLKIEKDTNHHQKALNIFYGLLIGIPIAILITALLVSADKYFGEFIIKIAYPLRNFNAYKVGDIIKIAITFLLSFSIFINVTRNQKYKVEKKELKAINNTSSIIVLSIINFVFLVFIVSEISKLTNNFLHLPVEYTYANYAREGFFELLLVTAINFLVINYHTHITTGFEKNKIIKTLLIVLIGFSIILIFNSYYRMFLYIGAYGFTTLRMQVILFLLMELILFSIFIKKVLEKQKYNYTGLFVIIAIVFYVLNIFMANSNFLLFLKTF